MHVLSTLTQALSLCAPLAAAAYTLQDDYGTDSAFFDKFSFFTGGDPTHGFVKYVDRGAAQSAGLINADGSIYMGVDYKNAAPDGRQSVRISSNKVYNHGLFILDLAHMPGKGVNEQTNNQYALHTSDSCTINNSGFSGSLLTSNCYINAPGQASNAGCGIKDNSAQSYGNGFNSAGGGVYATEWTGEAISVWFFPRSSIPGDIGSGHPNPSGWGTPSARFAGACNIDSHFKDLQIIFDTTFCGDWAGSVWGSSSCAAKGSCNNWVANNPAAFKDAFWRINSLKVYQGGAASVESNVTEWKMDVGIGRRSFIRQRRENWAN
ncbi:hypothetical protein APSETT445_002770 [Aspergillus pseudonomiae]